MKTLELNLADRIVLSSFLPYQGGKIKMLLVKDLAEKINLTPNEINLAEVKDVGNGAINYNPDKAPLCSIRLELTPEQVVILKECMVTADTNEAITLQMLPLVENIELL